MGHPGARRNRGPPGGRPGFRQEEHMSFVTTPPGMLASVPSVANALRLSASQSPLWYLSHLARDSRACNELITIYKTGPLDVEALRRALTGVVARHEAWRTTSAAVDGGAPQFAHDPMEIGLPLADLSRLSIEEAER